MKFGDKVRCVREKFSLTTEQLAKLLNVTQSYISHVENNRRQLGRDKIVVLAKELNIPVEFFLRDDVETLEEIEINDKLKTMLTDGKYLNYFVVVDKAVEANISPEELEQAIEFIKRYKKTQG
ncbi:helix-turn-helix transcriptional regulator [Sporomusa sp.]|uniref:helix-turn-helix domain-containing protein n=1 Tax=Sporomusa sp. TaxID=2078658 RepID=UPI002C87FCEF|nr:helix-turn-helix transcriptional regulator [Sporomusa sp.]HWR42052.1 helix-turn-helix transcriptional regulator [Sporomusa sp.]